MLLSALTCKVGLRNRERRERTFQAEGSLRKGAVVGVSMAGSWRGRRCQDAEDLLEVMPACSA